jgi:hypothetical protein
VAVAVPERRATAAVALTAITAPMTAVARPGRSNSEVGAFMIRFASVEVGLRRGPTSVSVTDSLPNATSPDGLTDRGVSWAM